MPTTVPEVLEQARAFGFLGPGPVEPQLRHAAGFAAAFAVPPGSFVDLGSGGGIPGLVLAELWPSSSALLVDAMARRAEFLAASVADLGWSDRIEVVGERAELVARARRERYDAVVARSFAPPPVTAECAAPLLVEGGLLVVSEPPEDAGRWPADGLAELGMTAERVVEAGARYQVLRQITPCPDRFPRRVGIPAKRPLW